MILRVGGEPVVTLGVCDGSPKPVKEPVRPASSRNGSTLEKFLWLKTFRKLVWNSKLTCSPSLMFLKMEALPIVVLSSCTGLRGVLPNGVPKMLWASPPFMMKRTCWLVTVTTLPVVLRALKLSNEFAGAPQEPGSPNRAQASAAKMPTAVDGALRLPRNGRAVSTPAKLEI